MYSVRISKVEINNIKNVENGKLSLINDKKNYKASVLGLYGQNGSGKTALIDSIEILKNVLCGKNIPDYFADYINSKYSSATLIFEFLLNNNDLDVPVTLEFSIRSVDNDNNQNIESNNNDSNKKVEVFNEILKCPLLSLKRSKIGKIIDTSDVRKISPGGKKDLFFGKSKDIDTELVVIEKLTKNQSRSFLFSNEILSLLRNRKQSIELISDEKEEFDYYFDIIESLVIFGNFSLFVVNTKTSGLISLNAQPISFKYERNNSRALGTIMIHLEKPFLIPEYEEVIVEDVIKNMNVVLKQVVPGLAIGIKKLDTQTLPDGKVGYTIQLTSIRNNNEIALKYESDGIKKIVSILQLLIVMYNQDSITVAIDELDAGVFEYLLGEMLRIISEKGHGQLIFTSHNLRILETIDKGFIAFTTTNPKNRYIRMTNVKETNNLRDYYYRDIMLGDQKEQLYDYTNNSEIAFAFKQAGDVNGS